MEREVRFCWACGRRRRRGRVFVYVLMTGREFVQFHVIVADIIPSDLPVRHPDRLCGVWCCRRCHALFTGPWP